MQPLHGNPSTDGVEELRAGTRIRKKRPEITIAVREVAQERCKKPLRPRGLTLTVFLIWSAREAAMKVLRERRVIELGRKDQRAFEGNAEA